MFIINLYSFLRGYVDLFVTGNFPERILNLCTVNGVKVWNIKKQENGLRICMFIKDFLNIRKIRGNSRLKLKIIKKRGVPIIKKRYKYRVGFPIGIALFFVILKFLSCFIWSVEIEGNTTVSSTEILSVCDSLGIKRGIWSDDIDTSLLRQKLLLKTDNLAWAALNIDGSVLILNVSEIKNEVKEKIPSNIVADFDGVIESVKVERGNNLVKKGDAVTKGDILISGALDYGTFASFVKSKGEIRAKVEEKMTISEKYKNEIRKPTKKIKNKYVLEFFNIKIPLYFGKTLGDYESKWEEKQTVVFGQKMPILLYGKKMNFYETEFVEYSREELLIKIEERFTQTLKEKGVQECEIVTQDILESDGIVSITYVIKYVKNIGIEEKILFDTIN